MTRNPSEFRSSGSPIQSPSRGIAVYWGWIGLFLLIFAIYSPVLSIGFVYDDLLFASITHSNPLTLPLERRLLWLIQRWFGYNGAAFHFLTLSLHMLNTALLYPVLRRLRASRFVSRCAVVLFGLFPFAHEPIAYIIEAYYSFTLLWVLVATVVILHPGPQVAWRRIPLALGAYLAAIFSLRISFLWPLWLLGIVMLHPNRFPTLRLVALISLVVGIDYARNLGHLGDPVGWPPLNFTLEGSLYAMQGWLHPLGPLLGGLWSLLFGYRPILLRALRPEDWAFLALGFGITIGMFLWARPRWTVALGFYGFWVSIAPALITWISASGLMNYPRKLLFPGIWSVLAWSGVLEGIRRRGPWGRVLAGGILGSTLTLSILFINSSISYYQDATIILKGMAQAAWEAGERPLLFVNLPYNVGYRWFRARYYPYHYGGTGAVLIATDQALAWYIRFNGGPDLTDRPAEWVQSARVDALYPNWFTPAPTMSFAELRKALAERAVYVFRGEDLSWIPLHRIWQVDGNQDGVITLEEKLSWLDPAPYFDGKIVLRGWRVEATTRELILLWEAQATPGRRWQVFVHLLDPEGRLIGQADGPMAGGLAPTDAWRRGDRVIDRHPLPAGIRPAAFRVGLYDLNSGERAVVEWGGELPTDRSVLLPAAIGP